MSVFNNNQTDHTKRAIFNDESGMVSIARYDSVKYHNLLRLEEVMRGVYWIPNEVPMQDDKRCFESMTENEQFIFTSVLSRQVILDSIQGRSLALTFLPNVSLPEVEVLLQTISFFETIHSQSYSHAIRTVYPNPDTVFNHYSQKEINLLCANDCAKYYDDYIRTRDSYYLGTFPVTKTELKKSLLFALFNWNALEGIRFYASFLISWAFAENKKMEGNAKIIQMIAYDEALHFKASTEIIQALLKDEPGYNDIFLDNISEIKQIYLNTIKQEKEFADYIFKDGTILGLNPEILKKYIDFKAGRVLSIFNIEYENAIKENPVLWMDRWLNGRKVQNAPQEEVNTSYIKDAINNSYRKEDLERIRNKWKKK